MIISLFSELQKLGQIILFGSTVKPSSRPINDIDIGVIVPNGHLTKVENAIEELLEHTGLHNYVFIQHLFAYDKYEDDRQKDQVLHILLCERKDLMRKHPIVSSLKKGVSMAFREVA